MNGTTRGAPINHSCVIFDIDGTLANNEHRLHHIKTEPADWKAFDDGVIHDTPIAQIVMLARILRQHYAIVLCTGRPENVRDTTQEWLRLHDIFHDGLYMRAAKDRRPDHVVKQELLAEIRATGFHPQMVVEDRASVVAMWREAGLVCLQCAPGDY